MAKMGRPKKDVVKSKSVGIRMTEQEFLLLQSKASEHNLTVTQAIQQGIELLYNSWESEDLKSLP